MQLFSKIVLVLFLSAGLVYAEEPQNYSSNLGEAERLMDARELEKAEDLLRKIVSSDPRNAKAHQLLGDVLSKSGKYKEAIKEYEEAERLGGENPELLKGIGTARKRLKKHSAAKAAYKRALELNPKDEEAKDDLESLERSRGVILRAWYGGWEPDYTKKSYEGMVSYGGFNRLDLNAGYSYSDQVFYTRNKVYASAYYFYKPNSYLKLYLANKDYDYPADATGKPNPDSNSYDLGPTAEIEVSHWIIKSIRGSLAYEIFKPTFFYDKDTSADNSKITTELYYVTPLDYLRFKLIYASLKDPDPDRTTIKGRKGATVTKAYYRTTSLLGGAVEVSSKKYAAEIKYLPNRDLDNSYEYSVLAGFQYNFTDSFSGKLDYVYDSYSANSNLPKEKAYVYMASGLYKLNTVVDLGAGYKYIDLPASNESTGFISIAYKTGLGF